MMMLFTFCKLMSVINVHCYNNVLYMDNTVLILTVATVQLIVDKVDAVSTDYRLEVSAQKTKIMVVTVRLTCN